MLDQLLETKQVRQRKPLGTTISVVLHAVLIAGAVALTQHTVQALPKPTEVIVLQPTKPDDPKPLEPKRPADVVAQAPSAYGHQELVAPVDVPLDIQPVDLSAPATNPADWTDDGTAKGRGDGVRGDSASTLGSEPMFVFQVDKPAAALPGSAQPAYPAMLTASGIEGEVLVQFVVDTLGRAEPASFTVLKASHDAFSAAVRQALPRMRFLPAEAGGQKVRMLVQQPFGFALNR
jgi:periplasmic protein TonB